MPHDVMPEPWRSFFEEVDQALDSRVELECMGGFAMAMLYGLPRPTADVDCLTIVPVEQTATLQVLAGRDSKLHEKYGVYVQHVGIATVPENYSDRLKPMFADDFRNVVLRGLEAHDLALSKLDRNSARDREDVKYLARSVPLDLAILEHRYRSELRPYLARPERHDAVLRLWLDMLAPT